MATTRLQCPELPSMYSFKKDNFFEPCSRTLRGFCYVALLQHNFIEQMLTT
jgi:hypothetical protein